MMDAGLLIGFGAELVDDPFSLVGLQARTSLEEVTSQGVDATFWELRI